jgi:hypothetical protein
VRKSFRNLALQALTVGICIAAAVAIRLSSLGKETSSRETSEDIKVPVR